MNDLVIRNISVLATPVGSTAKSGGAQAEIKIINNACLAIKDGRISFVGDDNAAPPGRVELDAGACLVTPGLVDAHTHAVFGGWRQHELALKLGGASYFDILKSGGGILSTVAATRKTDCKALIEKTAGLLDIMLAHGTTTCEIKSGYGLTVLDEIKQLKVIRELGASHKMDPVPTFMGAHAIPPEFSENREEYIKLICDTMLPRISAEGLAEFCDVFCEDSVFTVDESRRILTAAKENGLGIKLHADEIGRTGGAELAAELGTVSAEHLINASDEGIKAMAGCGVIAVLLPATSFYLDKPYARARQMIEQGVPVAIASDFNPGSSPNLNMQFPMTLACLKLKLTPAEALTAVTLNAAAAINRAGSIGTLETGKNADIIIWDAPDLDYLFYRYGNNQVKAVIKNGMQGCV